MNQNNDWRESVEYVGDQSLKGKTIDIVDNSLKTNGDLGVYGDLRPGIESLSKENGFRITDNGDVLRLEMFPLSREGHDFSMNIDKKTLGISNVVSGELTNPTQ